MHEHRTRERNAMFEHSKEKGCAGFEVKILHEITPGQDIAAVEDLYIVLTDPSINKHPKLDPFALHNFYMFSVLEKLSKGGLEALK